MTRKWVTNDALSYKFARDVGLAMDGLTDDTAAFAAFIGSAGSGVPVTNIDLGDGVIKLSSTITIDRKAIRFIGSGRGNPSDYANPGQGTTFRWAGAAGSPMFKITDSRNIVFQDIHFAGDDTNPPSDIVYLENTGGTVGTNEHIVFERCLFGYLPWNVGGTGMDTAVHVGGSVNANNDQFTFRDCQFMRPNTQCVKIDNTQSIWGIFENCVFDANSGTAKGISSAASCLLINPQFNGCSIDVEVNSTAQIDVYKWNSENSRKLFDVVAGGGRLIVRGGHARLNQITGGFYGTAGAIAGGCIDVAAWKLDTAGVTARPKMQVVGASMAGAPTDDTSTVSVVNCMTTKADFDITSVANGRVKIHIDDMGIRDDVQLTGVETYVPGLGKSRQTVYETVATHTHWTKRPSSLLGAHIWAHGPGSSGASGRRGATGTVRGGGGGGSPGAIAEGYFAAGDLPSSTFSFTIAAAAAGGAAVTANDTNGNPGALPANLVVGPLTLVHSSTAAQGGTTSGGAGGTGVANMAGVVGPAGATGGVGTSAPSAGTAGTYGGSGAGAGAGISTGEAPSGGSAGGATVQRTGYTRTAQSGGTGGVSGGAGAGAGNSPPSTERSGGTGGGGGASHATNAGQDGANGGMGAGGGGGAASTNGANSGKGGDGGIAKVIITEYHS